MPAHIKTALTNTSLSLVFQTKTKPRNMASDLSLEQTIKNRTWKIHIIGDQSKTFN